MRTTTEIGMEIKANAKSDAAYNRFANEGGEGYQRNTNEALSREFAAAYAAESEAKFAAEWTLETFKARKIEFNDTVTASRKVSQASANAMFRGLGYGVAELTRAKKLLGV